MAEQLSEAFIQKWATHLARVLPSPTKKAAFQVLAAQHATRTEPMEDIEFIVYYGEPQAQSHYKMWNPVFDRVSDKTLSVFRYAPAWWPVRAAKAVYPIALLDQCDALFARLPNLTAVFYPANNGVNLQSVRNTECAHVFLGHGDSNKASSSNKVFRLYDEVWVAGQAHIDRFSDLSGNYSSIDFRIIGQPWMQDWLLKRADYAPEDLVDWGYFPTWSGYYADTNYASLARMSDIIQTARRFAGLKGQGQIKLHPWTDAQSRRQAADLVTAQGDLTLIPQAQPLQNALARPLRFVICDISAALTECLYSNVPIFLYQPGSPAVLPDNFAAQNAFCYIFQDPTDLAEILERVILQGQDPLASARASAMAHLVDLERTREGQIFRELDRLTESLSTGKC